MMKINNIKNNIIEINNRGNIYIIKYTYVSYPLMKLQKI